MPLLLPLTNTASLTNRQSDEIQAQAVEVRTLPPAEKEMAAGFLGLRLAPGPLKYQRSVVRHQPLRERLRCSTSLILPPQSGSSSL